MCMRSKRHPSKRAPIAANFATTRPVKSPPATRSWSKMSDGAGPPSGRPGMSRSVGVIGPTLLPAGELVGRVKAGAVAWILVHLPLVLGHLARRGQLDEPLEYPVE